jgi:hypothetical protein
VVFSWEFALSRVEKQKLESGRTPLFEEERTPATRQRAEEPS